MIPIDAKVRLTGGKPGSSNWSITRIPRRALSSRWWPHSRVCEPVGLRGLRICIFNKFPGLLKLPVLRPMSENDWF